MSDELISQEFTKIYYIRVYQYLYPIYLMLCIWLVNDKFDKETTKKLAIQRAKEYWKETKFKYKETSNSSNIIKELISFIQRCTRYYKDKNIILPKIYIY